MTTPFADSRIALRTDRRVLVVTLDRAERRNAVDRAMADALQDAFDRFEADDALSVAVLHGAGGTFSAGGDLRELSALGALQLPRRGFAGLCAVPPVKPLVAAVDGYALGGGLEMALACDLMVLGPSAELGLPEVAHGRAALAGGAARLRRRIPADRAAELALTGRRFHAEEAVSWGLGIPADADGPLATALRIAHAIAAHPLPGLRETVRLLRTADEGAVLTPAETSARVAALLAAD